MEKMIFNGGQRHTYQMDEPIERYERVPFEIAEVITTEAPLEFHPKFADTDQKVWRDVTEFIPGVTAKMVDWWWGNMEKGYHVWAPGEHYGFDWIVPPCEVGYEGSIESSYEFNPNFPLAIKRESITKYPFTECYEHCWLSSVHNDALDELLVHMYQDVEGGIYWRSVVIATQETIDFLEANEDTLPIASHMEYESGRLKDFLPQLYALWEGHPDPRENVHFDLTTERQPDGTWKHKYDNKPHKIKICDNNGPVGLHE